MRVREIMTTGVETSPEAAPARDALERMRSLRIRHLVVTRGREIRGIVSDRDLLAADDGTVGERMTEDAVVLSPDSTVREAANLLRGRRIGSLPVVDGTGAVVGIVTTTDLLDLIGRGVEKPAPRGKRRDLARRGPRPRPAGPGAGRGR